MAKSESAFSILVRKAKRLRAARAVWGVLLRHPRNFLSRDSIVQGQITAFERKLRKSFGISTSAKRSLLDSQTFFLLLNIHSVVGDHRGPLLVIDVGASNGWYSHMLSKFLPNARFLLFEPQPSYAQPSNRQFQPKNSEFFGMAIGDGSNSFVELLVDEAVPGLSSTHGLSAEYHHFGRKSDEVKLRRIRVASETLDGLAKSWSTSSDDLAVLKIDVQGAEFEVIKGAEGLLGSLIKVVHFEYQLVEKYTDVPSYKEVIQYLERKGFELWDMNLTTREQWTGEPSKLPNHIGKLTEVEFLFVHSSLGSDA